jgi:Uma2 family endonuclease
MTQLARKTMTVAEYLAFEQSSETRHEYIDGELIEMPGETYQHNDIAGDIYIALKPFARAKGCRIAFESIKTTTRQTRYRYPDIVVSCQAEPDERFINLPCFILEVVSDSTADTDHGAKLEEYTKLPSLQAYAIVSQKTRQVLLYQRQEAAWIFTVISGSGDFAIPMLETTLSLDQIYASLAHAQANASIDANTNDKDPEKIEKTD